MGKFRDVKKTLKKLGATDEIIRYVRFELDKKNEIINQKSKSLEILNKKLIHRDKRYLEIKTVQSNKSKLTINPCDGRYTLKISHKSSEHVKKHYIKICEIALKDETLEPMTIRGSFHFKENKYCITLMSQSKRFTKYYEVEEEF